MSSTEIENNGGVYVVIATLPTAYLQYKQFLGRTARVGNKGQYSVILHDKDSKNADGRIYLQQKLEALESQDLLRATSCLNHLTLSRMHPLQRLKVSMIELGSKSRNKLIKLRYFLALKVWIIMLQNNLQPQISQNSLQRKAPKMIMAMRR